MGIVVLSGINTPQAHAMDLWNAVVDYQKQALAGAHQLYTAANQAASPEDKARLSKLASSLLENTFGVDEFGNINFGIGGQKDAATIKALKDLDAKKLEFRRASMIEHEKDPDKAERYRRYKEDLLQQPDTQTFLKNRMETYKVGGMTDEEAKSAAYKDFENIALDHWGISSRPSYESTLYPKIYQPTVGANAPLNDWYNQIIKGSGYVR